MISSNVEILRESKRLVGAARDARVAMYTSLWEDLEREERKDHEGAKALRAIARAVSGAARCAAREMALAISRLGRVSASAKKKANKARERAERLALQEERESLRKEAAAMAAAPRPERPTVAPIAPEPEVNYVAQLKERLALLVKASAFYERREKKKAEEMATVRQLQAALREAIERPVPISGSEALRLLSESERFKRVGRVPNFTPEQARAIAAAREAQIEAQMKRESQERQDHRETLDMVQIIETRLQYARPAERPALLKALGEAKAFLAGHKGPKAAAKQSVRRRRRS